MSDIKTWFHCVLLFLCNFAYSWHLFTWALHKHILQQLKNRTRPIRNHWLLLLLLLQFLSKTQQTALDVSMFQSPVCCHCLMSPAARGEEMKRRLLSCMICWPMDKYTGSDWRDAISQRAVIFMTALWEPKICQGQRLFWDAHSNPQKQTGEDCYSLRITLCIILMINMRGSVGLVQSNGRYNWSRAIPLFSPSSPCLHVQWTKHMNNGSECAAITLTLSMSTDTIESFL